jgi:hypothetical protein
LRQRWLGATGVRVPEIAVEGEDVHVVGENRVRVGDQEVDALVLSELGDEDVLHERHVRGTPVVVRAEDAEAVAEALEHPEVACALVAADRPELRDLDLRQMKYG